MSVKIYKLSLTKKNPRAFSFIIHNSSYFDNLQWQAENVLIIKSRFQATSQFSYLDCSWSCMQSQIAGKLTQSNNCIASVLLLLHSVPARAEYVTWHIAADAETASKKQNFIWVN